MENKHYVSIGCSYALFLDNLNYSHYKLNSFSQFGILEAIKLIKKNYENSTWIVGITQSSRLTKKIPEYIKNYPNYISNTESDLEGGYKKIGPNRFTSFIEIDEIVKEKNDFPYSWWKNEKETHYNKSIEQHLKDYLSHIYEIQRELVNFEYKMFLMNNTFEGYFYNNSILSHVYSNNTKYKTENLKNTQKLSDLFPNEWNRLDLSKFYFYQTHNFNYGGLDEFAIENYPISFFIDSEFRNVESPFGCHPNRIVQKDFIEKVLKL